MTDKERIARIEHAIAQIVTALEVTVAWRPEHNSQAVLAEIRNEQLEAIQRAKAEQQAVKA